jgi:hypothetical protein
MVTTLSELELACIERLSREQLVTAVRARAGDLPEDLLQRVEEQSTDSLQLILLAGRLIQVLRHQRRGG